MKVPVHRCAAAALTGSFAVGAFLVVAVPLRAQSVSSYIDVGVASGSAIVGPSASALLLQPSIRWDRPNTSVDAQASWLASPGARTDGDASVRGHYYSPLFNHFRLELSGAGERTAGPDVIAASNAVRAEANLSLDLGAGGFWLSRGQRFSASSGTIIPSQVREFGAGSWRRVGGVVVSASFTTSGWGRNGSGLSGLGNSNNPGTIDSSSNGDSTARSSNVARQYADMQSSVYWSHGPLSLDGLVGTRVSSSYGQRATWGRAQASWALGEQLALVASGGTRAPEPAIGRMGGTFVSLGVRLASAPWIARALHAGAHGSASAFGVRANGATRIIYVHAPAARTIELMADFTDWQPVAMRRAAADEWELALRIVPGAHRINIRVDGGEWSAPPGAGTIQDEFNGVVGLVVVP
jgi:hypothetical protein